MSTTAADLIRRAVTTIGVIQPGEYSGWDADNKTDALERLTRKVDALERHRESSPRSGGAARHGGGAARAVRGAAGGVPAA